MEIDIYADTICPWCFIGKRRFERARAARPGADLTVRWRAYQLNPEMPAGGMGRREYLEAKFGGREGARAVYERIEKAAAGEGLSLAFSAIERTPNTLESHRLIRLAGTKGRQDEVVEALFRAYFLEGRDIGRPAELVAAAEAGGLDPKEAEAYLESGADRDAVAAEDLNARLVGITGVPCYVFNGRHALPGAQPPEVLLRLFQLVEQEDAARAASGG